MRPFTGKMTAVAAILALMIPTFSWAQGPDTLEVDLIAKTAAHPFYGVGKDSCFMIDGLEARELTLVRGRRYVFHVNKMDREWGFYFSTSPIGEGREMIYAGMPQGRAYAYTGQYLAYTPVAASPDRHYYQASVYTYAGGLVHIVNSLPNGVEDEAIGAADRSLRARAWFSEDGYRLLVQHILERPARLKLELYDGVGRRVDERDLGSHGAGERITTIALDALPSGFYLYRITELGGGAVVTGRLQSAR